MATTITAGNATNGGAAVSADNTGILELKTGTGSGTTALTLGTTGNVNFPISGQRITGDFSNATVANRVLFQTSTTNNFTLIGAIPNGTSKYTQYAAWTGSTANESVGYMAVDGGVGGAVSFGSDRTGTGTYLPMLFFTGGSERMRIDTSGNLQFNSGYGSVATAYGCRAWVNFNGTAAGTFAGGTSTVTRVAGSTTATVTTTTAHGLITGNQVYALTGVAAGAYTITYISDTSFSFTTVATTALTNASITFAVNSIRASGNVSSVADNGTGDYTVNFTTAMPDANYAVNGFTIKASSAARGGCFINYDVDQNSSGTAPATTSIRVINRIGTSITDGNGGAIDSPYVSIGIFR